MKNNEHYLKTSRYSGSVFALHAELAFIKAWKNLFTPGMTIRMMTQDDLFGANMIPQ